MAPRALITIIAVVAVAVLKLGSCEDYYCRSDICPEKLPNIGCACGPNPIKAKASFAPQCANKNPQRVALDNKLKSLVLREHNSRRSLVACGRVSPFPPAAKMTELTWDDELEYLAWCNTRRCTYGHDQCRSTRTFPYAGQNIAAKLFCGKLPPTPEEVIRNSIDIWYEEHKNTTLATMQKFSGSKPGCPIGHFTLMVNDFVKRLGCSFVVFDQQPKNNKTCQLHYLVCNYSYANIMNQKTYTSSPKAGRDCSALSTQFPCLCNCKDSVTKQIIQHV